jgi:Protein of unknown function (DUF1659)
MANAVKNTSALVLTYKVGVNEENEDVFSSQRFSKINNMATEEEIYTLAVAMESLLAFPLHDIRKVDDFTIVEA